MPGTLREDFQLEAMVMRAIDTGMTTIAEVKSGAVDITDIQRNIAYKDMMNDIENANTPKTKGGR